jgi:fibrillarin-like rRNA methylase
VGHWRSGEKEPKMQGLNWAEWRLRECRLAGIVLNSVKKNPIFPDERGMQFLSEQFFWRNAG